MQVDKYNKYTFLIGKSLTIEGITFGEVNNETKKSEFSDILAFEKNPTTDLHKKVVAISNSLIDVKNGMDRFYWNPAPETFVSLFMNAKEVVTNSFHGFSFSIIFEKPMHVFELNSPGNERLLYLAKRFGLENRLLKNDTDLLNDRMTINNMEEIEKSKRYLWELLRNYAGKNN